MSSIRSRNRLRYACALSLAAAMVLATAAEAAVGVKTSNKVSEESPAVDVVGGKLFFGWSQRPRGTTKAKALVKRGSRKPIRLNPKGTKGFTGGIDGHVAVYQEIDGRQSNIRRFNLTTGDRAGIGANSGRWEYDPTISGNFILFGRQARRKDSVILFNRKTGDSRTLGKLKHQDFPNIQPGQVNGDFAVFYKCKGGGCDVVRYRISTRDFVTIPNKRPFQYGPSVTGSGTVYFAGSGRACGAKTAINRRLNGNTTRIAKLGGNNELSGHTFAAPRPGGGTHVYFSKGECKNKTSFKKRVNFDIFRVAD